MSMNYSKIQSIEIMLTQSKFSDIQIVHGIKSCVLDTVQRCPHRTEAKQFCAFANLNIQLQEFHFKVKVLFCSWSWQNLRRLRCEIKCQSINTE